MKLLTLNTHSLQEPDYAKKCSAFLEFILRERPDLIALQEVNQSVHAAPVRDSCGMVQLPDVRIPLKEDNHAFRIARRLEEMGVSVSWAWLPVKLGYGRYDEGLALMCMNGRITATDTCTISRTSDYRNWRTRKVLGAQLEGFPAWFYSVHMGWWKDEQEPFSQQWAVLQRHLSERRKNAPVWLLGDFNSPAEIRGQAYDMIAAAGWMDACLQAQSGGAGVTVRGRIDGWRRQLPQEVNPEGMRIDHIWCSESTAVKKCRVVFSGDDEPVVSDHFGILLETGEAGAPRRN